MLTSKKTIELGDHVFLDVIPSEDYVTIRLGDAGGTKVKKVDLWAACFAMADAKMQEQLLPIRQTEMVTFKRIHHVKAKKPIAVGQMINVKCEISVPQVVEEGLAGSLMKKRRDIFTPGHIFTPR